VVILFVLHLLLRVVLLLIILIGLLLMLHCWSFLSTVVIWVLVLLIFTSMLNLHLKLVLVILFVTLPLVCFVHLFNLLRGGLGFSLSSAFFICLAARNNWRIHRLRTFPSLEFEVRPLIVESLTDDLTLEVDHGKDDFIKCVRAVEIVNVYAFSILSNTVSSVFRLGHYSGSPVSLCKDHS
jgi:hypothetical protein